MAAASRAPFAPTPHTLWQLDAARGAAATYIALAHLCRDRFNEFLPHFDRLFAFGQEVVIAFFLLSGFVIHWSVEQKPDLDFRGYLRARALRIFPLYLLTLLATLVIARWQQDGDPRAGWSTLLGNIFMLQDWGAVKPGVWVDVYAGVLVLWSLSYEWWFYVLYYPVRRAVAPARQAWVVAAISLSQAAVYWWWPNQASRFLMYFCIWWTGVELARVCLARRPMTATAVAVPLGAMAAVAAVLGGLAWRTHAQGIALHAGVHPVLELRHFFAGVVLTLVALAWHRSGWFGMRPLFGGFVHVAPWAYALYLFHEPLALHANVFGFVGNPFLRVTFDLALVCAAAWLAETYFQRWCRRLFLR